MPLIPQQAVITATANEFHLAHAQLMKQIQQYPDVRVVSISATSASVNNRMIHIIAVVETV